jgi:multidrug efflux system membrane fusion protein
VHVVPQALAAKGLQAIKLPTTALRQEGQATAVWVYEADKGTVRSQVVQVATADGNDAVIVGGLTPGMQVVSTGVHVLTPGQKVVVFQQKSAPGQSGQAQAATKTVANGAAAAAASSAQ